MTLVHFTFSDSYRNPTKGSLAFMPHRRHAANEVEILPKPFTVALDGGVARVDLQPNTESWVWIVTEYFGSESVSRYYTVPEQDGVIDHTELIEISPSSLPAAYNAVEPVWWATMRQYKNVVSDNLLQSGVAIERAETAVEVAETAVEESQRNQSLSLAYRNESRQHSYDSRDYRDESREARDKAEEYRDDALYGPNNAADRSEEARDESRIARDESVTAQQASEAARDESQSARDQSITARNESQTARDESVTARDESRTARDESVTAQQASEAARDEATTGPNNAADRAENSATTAETARDETITARDETFTARDETATSQNGAESARDESVLAAQQAQETLDTLQPITTPYSPELLNEYEFHHSGFTGLQVWRENRVIYLSGTIKNGTPQTTMFELTEETTPHRTHIIPVLNNRGEIVPLTISNDGTVTGPELDDPEQTDYGVLYFNNIVRAVS